MLQLAHRHAYELIAVFVILLIPFVAMQFTSEVRWSPADFIVAGGLLVGLCVGVELVFHFTKKPLHRMVLAGAVLLAFILIWVELAVGIFGTPLAGS